MGKRQIKMRAQDRRLDAIRQELIRRIRPVCPDMADEFFLDLIESMAAIQLKYELDGSRVAS